MDKIDKKLILYIERNGETNLKKFAKEHKLSPASAYYRLSRLKRTGILVGLQSIMNPYSLGFVPLKIWFRADKKVEKALKANINIGWAVKLVGRWDYLAQIWFSDIAMLESTIANLCATGMSEYSVSIPLSNTYLDRRYLDESSSEERELFIQKFSGVRYFPSLNEVTILKAISSGSNLDFRSLAKSSGVSPSTAYRCVCSLRNNGVILGYRAMLDYKKIGREYLKVLLYPMLPNASEKQRLIARLKAMPEVIYITETVGESQLEFEADVPNDSIDDFLSRIDPLVRHDVFVMPREIVHRHFPPL